MATTIDDLISELEVKIAGETNQKLLIIWKKQLANLNRIKDSQGG